MKQRHNKKRNTAFLYETLIVELTKSSVRNDTNRKRNVIAILKEFFSKGTILSKQMEIYKAINETSNVELVIAEKILTEAKIQHDNLDKNVIFENQSALIKKINQILGKNVFSNFVPNYKNLATLSQMFNFGTPIKRKVILEQKIVQQMSANQNQQKEDKMVPIDNLVYKTFVGKFNEQYGDGLHEEQKDLLGRYIMSFADNGVEFKVFLNEELGRIKQIVKQSLGTQEISKDSLMSSSTNQVLSVIDSFKTTPISENMIGKVLKMQNLAREIQS